MYSALCFADARGCRAALGFEDKRAVRLVHADERCTQLTGLVAVSGYLVKLLRRYFSANVAR